MLSNNVQFCQTKCFRILHFGYCSHLTNESLTPVARKDKCEDDFILLQQKAAAQGTGCPKPHLMKMESKSAGHTSASHHYHSVWKSPKKSHSKLSLHLKVDKNGPSWRIFAKLKMAVKQCYQTGHFVIGPKIGRKGQNWIMKCDILSNFQTLWSNRIMGERVIKFWQKWKSISIVLMGATMYYNQIDNQCIYRSHSVYGFPPSS